MCLGWSRLGRLSLRTCSNREGPWFNVRGRFSLQWQQCQFILASELIEGFSIESLKTDHERDFLKRVSFNQWNSMLLNSKNGIVLLTYRSYHLFDNLSVRDLRVRCHSIPFSQKKLKSLLSKLDHRKPGVLGQLCQKLQQNNFSLKLFWLFRRFEPRSAAPRVANSSLSRPNVTATEPGLCQSLSIDQSIFFVCHQLLGQRRLWWLAAEAVWLLTLLIRSQ